MAYRKLHDTHHMPHAHRTMQDTSTPSRMIVENGSWGTFAIPCWYIEVRQPSRQYPHNVDLHDHLGWPDPKRVDRSCQKFPAHPLDHTLKPMYDWHYNDVFHRWWHYHYAHHHHLNPFARPLLDMRKVIPIHLTEEGYTRVDVAIKDKPSGVTVTGRIDEADDWIVRLDYQIDSPEATDKEISLDITARVFASAQTVLSNSGKMVNVPARKDTVFNGKIIITPAEI